jgi:hypothetical protein
VVVNVSEGISKEAYPSELEDFLAWVNKFGDHFGGDQCARASVLQDSESLAKLHKMLEQELHSQKHEFQACTTLSASTRTLVLAPISLLHDTLKDTITINGV